MKSPTFPFTSEYIFLTADSRALGLRSVHVPCIEKPSPSETRDAVRGRRRARIRTDDVARPEMLHIAECNFVYEHSDVAADSPTACTCNFSISCSSNEQN